MVCAAQCSLKAQRQLPHEIKIQKGSEAPTPTATAARVHASARHLVGFIDVTCFLMGSNAVKDAEEVQSQ